MENRTLRAIKISNHFKILKLIRPEPNNFCCPNPKGIRLITRLPPREKCPYSELFWSVFSRIRTEYGEILRMSPYSVRMRENTDQNNSENGHFLRSVRLGLSHLREHKFKYSFQDLP